MIFRKTKLMKVCMSVMLIFTMTACGKASATSSEADIPTETQTVENMEVSTSEAIASTSEAIASENNGTLRIVNVDQNEKRLPGSKFEIKDSNGNVVVTKMVDSDGLIELSNANADEYIITEVEAPDGYIWDDTPQTLEVKSNHTSTITFVNVKVSSGIKINVLDEDGIPLENMEFAILDAYKNQIGDTIVSDSDGIAYKELSVGKYFIRCISVPSNIIKDDEDHEVEITSVNETLICNITCYYIRGKFHIKVSGEDGAAVAGAKYNIYNADDKAVAGIVTDENGEGSTDYLKNGQYYIKEISLPDGRYKFDDQKHEFTMEYEDTTYSHFKYLSTGNIEIIVKDKAGNPVSGIKYEVRKDDEGEQLVDTIVTDQSGTAISKMLPLGNYYYKEIEVPDGIRKDSTEYAMELDKANYTVINRITK